VIATLAETKIEPETEAELADAVRGAGAAGTPLELLGGGSRRGLGGPVQAAAHLSTARLRGISLYEPGALTLVVAAGTPVTEVEAALAAEGQRFAFEPMDHRTLLGTEGAPTIGGMVATGSSGPRRIQAGACRDAILGVRFVNGRGEAIKSGGRVMKNVTGYDLPKLLCGSHGTLGVITEVAFKVLPAPEAARTLIVEGLEDAAAIGLLGAALGTPFEVTGAAHLPAQGGEPARTALRIEGLGPQVDHRSSRLSGLLAEKGAVATFEGHEHEALWADIRDCQRFARRSGAVWRLSLKPSDAPRLVAGIAAERPAEAFYDWGGGLVWLLTPETEDAGAAMIRAAVARVGGHATLIRASAPVRSAVPVFQPQPAILAQISAGLRSRFDPAGVFNRGRMGA